MPKSKLKEKIDNKIVRVLYKYDLPEEVYDLLNVDIREYLDQVQEETKKEIMEEMPKRPKGIEILDKKLFQKRYPETTGTEIDIENKRRQNAYFCYLKNLESWVEALLKSKK